MKSRIFSLLFTGAMLCIVFIGFSQVLNKKPEQNAPAVETSSKVTEYKKKSREALKPYRYDASNVTHFNYAGFEQKKTVEVMLFNGTEYKLNFNTEGAPKAITVQIFDKPSTNQARIKLIESVVQGGEFNVLSTDLNKKYNELKGSSGNNLKRIYVDYIIPANDTKEPLKGFAILTYGYKNI